MANYNNLKAGIDAVIKTNGRQEISGAALNTQLKNMITELGAGYQYMGVATPATNPGTPDANVFYLASEAGTYTNFRGIVINEGEVCALVWNGTWTKEVSGIATAESVSQLGQKVVSIDNSLAVAFAVVDNAGYINTYIDLYGVLYPIDRELDVLKSILDTISKNVAEIENYELLSFAIVDKNGYVNEYIGTDGRLYQGNYSNIVSERNKYADSIVLRSLVESNLNKIHAFSVYGCFDDKGNMYALYNSSAEHLYEYLEPDSDFALEISKYNICTPYDKEFKRVIGNNDVIDGSTYKTPYNSWMVRHNDENHVNVGSIKDNIGVAFYDIVVADDLEVGIPTPCTLTYNGTTVDFTITNYLHALYVLGIIDTDSEFEGEAIDNIKPCYYNGKYYKVMRSSMTGSGKIVIMTSTDLIDWTIEGTVGNVDYSCTEMSLIVDSDILYIAYREDESTGYKTGYIIYNLSTDSLINSGWFKFSIAEKPCVFKYQGNIYMLIGVETEIYNNDNERREAIEIYRIRNNVPTSYLHAESPYGINYADILVHTSEQIGNYDTLYMLYSEDRRKLAPYASYSDVAMCELTDLFINN